MRAQSARVLVSEASQLCVSSAVGYAKGRYRDFAARRSTTVVASRIVTCVVSLGTSPQRMKGTSKAASFKMPNRVSLNRVNGGVFGGIVRRAYPTIR